jgi:hypothetical protein
MSPLLKDNSMDWIDPAEGQLAVDVNPTLSHKEVWKGFQALKICP